MMFCQDTILNEAIRLQFGSQLETTGLGEASFVFFFSCGNKISKLLLQRFIVLIDSLF